MNHFPAVPMLADLPHWKFPMEINEASESIELITAKNRLTRRRDSFK